MYCKYCGKQIADDSRFCQECGGKLSDVIENYAQSPVKVDFGGEIHASLTHTDAKYVDSKNFIKRNVYLVISYCLWFLLNLVLFIDIRHYEFSEFIIYVFILPLAIYLLIILYRKYKKQKEKEQTQQKKVFKHNSRFLGNPYERLYD